MVEEFQLKTLVIPAQAGHAGKLLRYPGSDQLNGLDPRLRGNDDTPPEGSINKGSVYAAVRLPVRGLWQNR